MRSPLRSPAQVEGSQGFQPQPEKDLERPTSTRLGLGLAGPQCQGVVLTKLGSPDVHLLKLGPRGHQHRQARENSPEKRSCPRPPAFWLEHKPGMPGPHAGRSLAWGVVRDSHCAQPCPGLALAQAASRSGRDPVRTTPSWTQWGKVGPSLRGMATKPGSWS